MKKFTRHPSYLLCISISLFLLLFIIPPFFFLNAASSSPSSPSSSANFRHQRLPQHDPSSTRRVILAMEEKARLGSTPPSCYNKCNGCHPCLAVQVPTLPVGLHGKRPTRHHTSAAPTDFLDPSPEGSGYSNYKPLGWKCRCRNHLFNP